MAIEKKELDQFYELSYYTLSHPGDDFIHQHAVDAFTAQNATEHTKPIALYFALVGLYLYLERNFTGKQVQNIHVLISHKTKSFPLVNLPVFKGEITITDVLAAKPGMQRDNFIRKWCESIWITFKSERANVIDFTDTFLNQ